LRKDGSVVEGTLDACLVHDPEGRPLMYVGLVEDLTDRLRSERDASESRDRLAHLTRLNLLGEMAASLAHEMNQPLTAISTYAHAVQRMLAQGPGDTAPMLDALGKISIQSARAIEVIQRLRGFVRRQPTEPELVRVDRAVREIVGLAEVDAKLHGLTIRVAADAGPATVVADPVQLQQVILNLLRNAIEAMDGPACLPRIIDLRVRSRTGGWVRISVCDRGAGISPEVEDRLFTTFFSTKPTGLGIGLPISRSIVESLGGRLWFTRNPDRGTTFHVELPFVEGEADGVG
jgi:C4-dicarboxylate-specific signal transduction histidine kinase